MTFKLKSVLFAIFALTGIHPLFAQQLPMDPAIRHGRLDNGLTYYIRHNENPKKQADFYIVQRVGSILEEEEQRGLAHFLEHMAFNGTKNFPGKSMIQYLEKNGVQFGTNINAFTSFDHTVYNLNNVPVERWGMVDSCLLILHDWSGCISLEGKEIDAERKVIHEEWRTRANAKDRIYAQTLHTLFPDGNKYAERMPIGLMKVVDHCSYQVLRDYYHKWYRPDLQGIIVVGDIDVDQVEKRIKALWQDIQLDPNAAERVYQEVADNKAPIVAIGHDPEMMTNSIRVSFKYDLLPDSIALSQQGKKIEYLNMMATQMLNLRLGEKQQEKESPFFSAQAFDGFYSISQTKKAFATEATFDLGQWQQALNGLIYEIKRAWQFGFTSEELEQLKANIGSSLDAYQAYAFQIDNHAHVERCMGHFLYHRPAPSVTDECELMKELLEKTSLEEINRYFHSLITGNNVVLLLQGQTREGYTYPDREEVVKAYYQAWKQEPQPYRYEKFARQPLLDTLPEAGSIVKSEVNTKLNAVEMVLSNGAKVILKPTQYHPNTLSLTAISEGGTSVLKDEDLYNFNMLNTLPALGGLGKFSGMELGKMLTGCTANYQTNVGLFTETFSGNTTLKDLETFMQLLYLRFTTVRQDQEAFERWKKQATVSVQNSFNDPMTTFGDTLRTFLYKKHPRAPKASMNVVTQVDYDRVCELFKERFANAADFTFILVGDMHKDFIEPLICRYIASLPSTSAKKEVFNGKAMPELKHGKHRNRVEIPMQAPRTTVIYNIRAKEKYTQKGEITSLILRLMLEELYTEKIREEAGGSYGVATTISLSRFPKNELDMMINFNTSQEMASDMLQKAIDGLNSIAQDGPDEESFKKAIEYIRKSHNGSTSSNEFWTSVLTDYTRYNSYDLLHYSEDLESITLQDVQKMARKLAKSKETNEIILDGIKRQ